MSNSEENKGDSKEDPESTASIDSSVLGPGTKIGRYKIERELGRGAMGVVYLTYDPKLFRSVAIKSVPEEITKNPQVRLRFQREARLLAGLNHPNIGAIHDQLEEAAGLGYLVLEYVPGDTLEERILRGPMPWERAFSIGQQIAEAVGAAYKKGVIHRDLKPANIKITPEGVVKVLDFGLAKAIEVGETEPESSITKPGRMIGSPAYMSPEQALGDPADHRSDIWAFGCILFEMLTGRIPFEGGTISDTLAKVLKSPPDWQILPEDTPSNIRTLLRRCLEKNPNDRLQHIGDISLEIKESRSMPLTAEPVSFPLKSRLRAGLLGIFLGGLGIHRFYLGYTRIGIIQLLMLLFFSWFTSGVTALAAWVWGMIEGIMILVGTFQKDVHGRNLK